VKGRLSRQAVRDIREWWAIYHMVPKPREIGRRYGINRSAIYDIVRGRRYKAVQ
jgi:hypothetical protein